MISKTQKNIKTSAKISFLILLLSIAGQLISIYQTNYQVVSPLIPKSTIWEISKQFIFIAFVLTVSSIIALVLYFYEKYLAVIILAVLTLIAGRFIYI
jgi:hypothetical protein